MASITTTDNAAIIPTLVAAETLGALKSNAVLARLVNSDYSSELASYGDTVDIGFRGAVTAGAKSAETDLTPQGPATTKVSAVLDQHYAVPLQADDIALMFSRPEVLSGYAMDSAIALADTIDDAIAGLYSGFSQTIDATSGLGEDDFREGRRLLNSAKAPLQNRYAVLHEDADYELLGIEKVVNRDYAEALGSKAAENFTGRFMGFDIFMDQNINVATGQAKNLFFQRDAMVFVSRPMRQTSQPNVVQAVMAEDGFSIRVTMTYNALGLAEVLITDVLYGFVELRDTFGIAVSTTEI